MQFLETTYARHVGPELDMDWIHPWIGLGQDFQATLWIGLDWIHELMDWIGSAKMDPCPTLCRPIQGGFCVFGVINTITVSAQFLGYNTALMCLSVHCL